MEPLIKVTTEPLQAIHFTQKARLVPSDHIDLERRKAMAQYFAFNSSHREAGSSADMEHLNKINNAFSSKSAPVPEKQTVSPDKPAAFSTKQTVPQTRETSSVSFSAKDMQAVYTIQRGSLELRAAKGELSFLPPLVMTIITRYPAIHFEYTGGFRYVPPQRNAGRSHMNLFI